MNVPTLIVSLYPPGVRQRWGTEMAREVAASGPRSWPDTVIGAVRLWTHPGDWPETASGQTRRVLAAALFAEAAVAALLLRAAGPPRFLVVGPGHRALLPLSALAGAIFLVWADTGARTLFDPRELPVGILTALIGGPVFAWLLLRRRSTT